MCYSMIIQLSMCRWRKKKNSKSENLLGKCSGSLDRITGMRVVISRDRNKSERFLVSKINYISGNQRSRGAGVMVQWKNT